jgi:hypothetical protein
MASLACAGKTVTDWYATPQEATARLEEANREHADWGVQVAAAQSELLATGFPVPDSWLLVDTTGKATIQKENRNWKELYRVTAMPADSAALGTICGEIRIVLMQLQVASKLGTRANNKGGRTRKWDDLIALDKQMHLADQAVQDKDIVKAYNQKYAGLIGQKLRTRATVKILHDARCYRTTSTKSAIADSSENPPK